MITKFSEVIKGQGWQVGQMAECDIWVGTESVRHLTRVMYIGEGKVYAECDKHIDVDGEVYEHGGRTVLDYGDELVVLAYSQKEALEDYKTMKERREEQGKANAAKLKDAIETQIKALCELMKDARWYQVRDAAKGIDFGAEEYYLFNNFIHYAGYEKDGEAVDDDTLYEIRHIWRQHGFFFSDKDNGGIHTWVNLDQAVSVVTNCEYKGKSCVIVEMPGKKEYHVYEDGPDPETYFALEALYEA